MSPSEKKPTSAHRLGIALPGAIGALLIVGVVAFGATAPSTFEPDAPRAEKPAPASDLDTPKPADAPVAKVDPEPVEQPVEDPKLFPRTPKEEAEQPAEKPKATEAPAPKPAPAEPEKPKATEAPAPKPAPVPTGTLALEGWVHETKAKLGWTAFAGDGFEYYKLVRSADATVAWPAGADDVVVAAIGDPKATWWADKPGCGTAWTYAVFAVRHGDGGYVTLATSNVVTLTTTCAPEPTEKPATGCGMEFEAWAKPGIGVKLAWKPCHDEAFAAYKVVRSLAHADPRFPLNDGTELVGVIGDRSSTTFVDEDVAAGETWTYRVVAVAEDGGALVVIGESDARSVTAE